MAPKLAIRAVVPNKANLLNLSFVVDFTESLPVARVGPVSFVHYGLVFVLCGFSAFFFKTNLTALSIGFQGPLYYSIEFP
jgi:hypothetical protein